MDKILVVCPTYWDRYYLRDLQKHCEYIFIGEHLVEDFSQDVLAFIEQIKATYYRKISGVMATHDYPSSMIAAVLAKELEVPGCPPDISITMQHKYYSRQLQQKIIPEVVPKFTWIDSATLQLQGSIDFPIFVKPVKAMFSFLAKKIDTVQQLRDFIRQSAPELHNFVAPFNQLLQRYTDLKLDGGTFVAEEYVVGEQVTVEGYVYNNNVTIMGIADSVMYPNTNSFQRFEYPSKLPAEVLLRMTEISRRFIENTDYDNCMFNIEYFYDKNSEAIHLIEVNTRMSSIFADLFAKVDGCNSYEIQVDLALGKPLEFVAGRGDFAVSAVFVLRVFADKIVERVPSDEEQAELQKLFPDMILKLDFATGERLSSKIQSTGSYKYATIHLGGQSWDDLYTRFSLLRKRLDETLYLVDIY